MTRRIKVGGLLVAAVLAVAMLSLAALPRGTHAEDPYFDVETWAEVKSSGSPPSVNYKWELPDMAPLDPGMQYCPDGWVDLNGNGICDADDDPLTPGMQMTPNINDDPEPRLIEFWVAADDPNGLSDIAAVWTEVFHPDGSPKYQVDLVPVDCLEIGFYDDSTSPATLNIHDPLLAAIDTEQMSWAEAEDLVIRCYKNEKSIWKGQQRIHTHQPPGMYLVKAFAQDWGSALSLPLENYFEVLPIVWLNIDFSVVDWGEILPDREDWVSGDEDMTTPDKPTLKNGGNVPLSLGIHFEPMIRVDPWDPTKVIDVFDARFMGEETGPLPASVWYWFMGKLPPCTPKQLDLSIHPPFKLAPGIYSGWLNISAVPDP